MRLLITGQEGLVGTALCNLCYTTPVHVTGVDIRASDSQDIRSERTLGAMLPYVDGVVHLAAISRVAWGEADPRLCEAVNVDGTAAILEAIETYNPKAWLVFASSREVYGNPRGAQVVESDPLEPVNAYGRSKLAGERLVQKAQANGLRAAIVRLSNVYGGRADHPDRAVPALMQRALDGAMIDITGGDHYFDFVHVDDVARALLDLCQLLHEGSDEIPPFHLTTGIATSLSELAQLAVSVAGSQSLVREVPARAFDVHGFCGDPRRAAAVLGWEPRISLREGIAMVADDLRRNGPLASADPFAHLR